mgnify:CR=1 FL=1
MNASLYRKGDEDCKKNKELAIFAHCEDITMVEGGVMHADKKGRDTGAERN